jgi:hypothetical protein
MCHNYIVWSCTPLVTLLKICGCRSVIYDDSCCMRVGGWSSTVTGVSDACNAISRVACSCNIVLYQAGITGH